MNFLPPQTRPLLPSLSLVAALSASLAGEPLTWQLRPAAQVDSTGIHLDQLISNAPLEQAHLRLASAPGPDQSLTFTRAQINALLEKTAPDLASTNWSGVTQVKITRRTRPLDEAGIKSLLTETLQKDFVKEKGELELRFTRAWNTVAVVDESLTLRVVDLPSLGVTPNCIVRFELKAGDELLGTWQATVTAKVWRDVWVAGSSIKRGQPVLDADLVKERRDVLALRDALGVLETDKPGLEIAENIPAGGVLTSRSIKQTPVVRRGRIADAVVRDGALLLSMKVEVLEDGVPGQTVRVRNQKTKREFRGTVQNEETIHVSL